MVFFNEKKFACQTCIKGHRSSGCKHTDRPLFEIKKKGRPVTQCDHCRELRKTKQVHVKCQCGSKGIPASPPSQNKRISEPPIPSFPNGISTETLSSLNHSRSQSSACHTPNPCLCEVGGECTCCTPRSSYKSKSKRSPTPSNNTGSSYNLDVETSMPDDHPKSDPRFPSPGAVHSPDLQPYYSQETLGVPAPFDTSVSNRSDIELWDNIQVNGGYSGSSQSQPDLAQYNANVNSYQEQTSLQIQAPSLAHSPICNCGLVCQCPGCSEHPGPDGFPSAAPTCTIGCSSGLGCLNDPHVHHHTHSPSDISAYHNPAAPSHLYQLDHAGHIPSNDSAGSIPTSFSSARYPSTASFHTLSSATSYTTMATVSHLDGSVGYSHAPTWSSGTSTPTVSENSRRTSFAISGERDASSPNSSLTHPHIFPVDRQAPSSSASRSNPPFINQRSSSSNMPSAASSSSNTSNSKPSVVRRGFQRLLPRNPPELAPNPGSDAPFIHPVHHLPPTGQVSIPSSHPKALRGETAAAFNRSTMMPYNRFM